MAALFLASCGGSVDTSLDERLDDKEDIDNAANSFANGNAKDGEEYFAGLLAAVIEVDVKFREVLTLDEDETTTVEKFNATMDSCLRLIDEGRTSIDLYKNKSWPLRAEFHDLTIEWFQAVEDIVNDHFRGLAEIMVKPDEDWTDEEIDQYIEMEEAYDSYIEVDTRWVEFQKTYAAANNFLLDDNNVIDVDALVEEEMAAAE